jgi:hypothetical protein
LRVSIRVLFFAGVVCILLRIASMTALSIGFFARGCVDKGMDFEEKLLRNVS